MHVVDRKNYRDRRFIWKSAYLSGYLAEIFWTQATLLDPGVIFALPLKDIVMIPNPLKRFR
jgi:hypothetical protein